MLKDTCPGLPFRRIAHEMRINQGGHQLVLRLWHCLPDRALNEKWSWNNHKKRWKENNFGWQPAERKCKCQVNCDARRVLFFSHLATETFPSPGSGYPKTRIPSPDFLSTLGDGFVCCVASLCAVPAKFAGPPRTTIPCSCSTGLLFCLAWPKVLRLRLCSKNFRSRHFAMQSAGNSNWVPSQLSRMTDAATGSTVKNPFLNSLRIDVVLMSNLSFVCCWKNVTKCKSLI